MSSLPNHVGSAHDKQNAEMMLAKFKSWGWEEARTHVGVIARTLDRYASRLETGAASLAAK